MNKIFIYCLVLFALISVGCVKPRINTSTDDKMKESVQKLKDSLNEKQKTKFEQAVGYIAFDRLTFGDLMSSDDIIKKIKDKFKDKSYEDIISDAKKIVKERIFNLKNEKTSSEAAKKSLESILVEKITLTTDNSGFLPRRILSMIVKNNTGATLSAIAFSIKTFSPGREVPYLDDKFKYEIPGGIQSGEKLEWQLQPNTFLNNEWNRDIPNGIIVIKAIACSDSKGNLLYSDDWDTNKDKMLEELEGFMKD